MSVKFIGVYQKANEKGYSLDLSQEVGIVGMVGRVGRFRRVEISGINILNNRKIKLSFTFFFHLF